MKRLSLLFALLVSTLGLVPALPAFAVSGSQFNASRIVDDSIFFHTNTMNEPDIQNFLNGKVPVCDSNGTQIYSGSTTRAQYSASKGYPAPFICLKDYHTNINYEAADAYCNTIQAENNASSAHIISVVSQDCGINPQVLIVLLQKEQALVTDDWPWPVEYQKATGFACPDTAACDTTYSGLLNQLYYAARQFKKYQANPGVFSFASGRTSAILFNPNSACGSSNVTIQTNATADLYNYTPYQPNGAALNNMYGSGDNCSAYGNRNFWRYFNDWFGVTTSDSAANTLNFIRLNHSSGQVEIVGYSSISSYATMSRYNLSGYPAVSGDSNVVPLGTLNAGYVSFIRLNHSSGHAEIVTYSRDSGYGSLNDYELTGYPAVAGDGNVVPEFSPNGDLNFIRLNHSSGHVELVSYSASSSYKRLTGYNLSDYPAVPGDGNVVPLFTPSGDLSFIRLNHSSGHVEIVTYSRSSGYKQLIGYSLSSYPAVAGDGNVVPEFSPNGDLNFIRLNHSSGKVEIVSYTAGSGYTQMSGYFLSGYPAITDPANVKPVYNR